MPDRVSKPRRRAFVALLAVACVIAAAAAGLAVLISKFPFKRDALLARVRKGTGAEVTVGAFHERWLPPGFDASGVRLTDREGDVLTIDSIELRAGYTGLLSHPADIGKIRVHGARLAVNRQTPGKRSGFHSPGGTMASEIHIEDSALVLLPPATGGQPLEFAIHTLTLRGVATGRSISFDAAVRNPKPQGEIRARGRIGPFGQNLASVPAAADFTFDHADLNAGNAISGFLNASGAARGTLGRLAAKGSADIPQFHVQSSAHSVHVAATFDATVNALTGDAALNAIKAHFDSTTVMARGTVASGGHLPGKTLTLDTSVREGRLQDLLLLFTRKPTADMDGAIRLDIRFALPPGPPDFLDKLQARGTFAIANATFTNAKVEVPIDRLSQSAEGELNRKKQAALEKADPGMIVAEAQGNVSDARGTAKLTGVTFRLPGVQGNIAGTFGLRRTNMDFQGELKTAGELADTTKGFKALLLNVIGPLFVKRKDGNRSVIPFSIAGTAGHPIFRLKLQ